MGMNLNNAVGQSISFNGAKGNIIGVVQDFNFKPLQYAIDPLIMQVNKYGGTVVVRAPAGNTEAAIAALGTISRSLNPAYPYTYNFIDKDLGNLYKGEQQMGRIFNFFAILAIFISCIKLPIVTNYHYRVLLTSYFLLRAYGPAFSGTYPVASTPTPH
jgi:hypothetical protein